MPSWTTGGTDVICEREKQTRVERESVKDRRKKKKRNRVRRERQKGKRERKSGMERKRDAMRQGYGDERKASLSLHFFNIPSS